MQVNFEVQNLQVRFGLPGLKPGQAVPVVLFHTKGFALVIPLLPPRARERGAEKLPHTHERRLVCPVGVQ